MQEMMDWETTYRARQTVPIPKLVTKTWVNVPTKRKRYPTPCQRIALGREEYANAWLWSLPHSWRIPVIK